MLTLSQLGNSIGFEVIFIAELLRYFTWFYVLQQASGLYLHQAFRFQWRNPFSPAGVIILFALAISTLLLETSISSQFGIQSPNILEYGWMMIISIFGLALVEQLYRNTDVEYRSRISYLVVSAGAIFSYDFFVFANAILLKSIDYEYWSARGIINVLITPTLILAAVRNPSLAPNLHISRKFVFHSSALVGAGIYLILMSLAGYFIKANSGNWGNLLQITFLFATFVLLAALFFSSTFKTKIKRYVSQNFSNKYDYRDEWNRFSSTLLTQDTNASIYKLALKATAQILECQGATLWLKDGHQFNCVAGWKSETLDYSPIEQDTQFIQILENKLTPLTLQHYFTTLSSSRTENLPFTPENSWLFLPLNSTSQLFGFIHLRQSVSEMELDHEDIELLTTITHHVALYLSQHEVSKELQRAERFKSINQMTAFLTHDLKTLLSQLFLLVENGKIHKDNPAFIEDMLNTLDHVSRKMQRLVNQLKDPVDRTSETSVSILEILEKILADYKLSTVKPVLINNYNKDYHLQASKDELCSALKHIIQNAVDSVEGRGSVQIELVSNNNDQLNIKITDNGKGMSQEFIANRLFQPFESTKGVSGMGIGVYQSREYIRSLGGDIQVSSQLDEGSTFTITLPVKI